MNKAIVTLKKGEGRMLKSGGAWIFDNEIESVMGNFDDGDIVLVHDFDGYPLGRKKGIYQPPFQDMGTDVDEEYRSGDQRGVFREKASGRMGISEEDCGYFKLPILCSVRLFLPNGN